MSYLPLAEKYRPQDFSDVLGQEHLLNDNGILKKMISNKQYSSFILWGNPGTGKTTIAQLFKTKSSLPFIFFSAVLSGIKEVKEVMKEAEQQKQISGEPTIIFIDEIHRFNRSQQDAFLHYVETGAIILIGATTENPSFNVISALLSRCHVFILNQLSIENITKIIFKILLAEEKSEFFSEKAIEFLAHSAGGDTRKAINLLEICLNNLTETNTTQIYDENTIQEVLSIKTLMYDKKGEEHYNLISALHKSLRGSDPQAGLYWLARMLESGDDPLYIIRRLVRFAAEDIGLADPNALVQAIAVKDAFMFLGMPESNVCIAQLVVYLATAPKSNSVYKAVKLAQKKAQETGHEPVPFVIRNAPTKLMKDIGYGSEYKYDHDYENHYYYQKYFPDNLKEETYYEPSKFGFEKDISKRIEWWSKLKERQLKNEK